MKLNKLKVLSIAIGCLVSSLTEIKGAEQVFENLIGNARNMRDFDMKFEIETTQAGILSLNEQLQKQQELNAVLTNKLEIFSQQFTAYQSLINLKLEQEQQEKANLNHRFEQLLSVEQGRQVIVDQLRQRVSEFEASQQGCAKAWVVYKGGQTVSSYNCTLSRTHYGTFTVNFTVPFSSNNYSVGGSVGLSTSHTLGKLLTISPSNYSANSINIYLYSECTGQLGTYDTDILNLQFFGDQ